MYIIGDIQGCANALERLLERIPANADVWFCGDLINRGPDNVGVLRIIRALGSRARVVLGNHDIHFLGLAAGVRKLGRSDTLHDLLNHPECTHWVDWLSQWPLAHYEHGILMVHAGVLPQWTVDDTLHYAKEISNLLSTQTNPPSPADERSQSGKRAKSLQALFGNCNEVWHPKLEREERQRMIVNALTRMRVCDADGRMEPAFKGSLKDIPAHLTPWFALTQRATRPTPIVFGHWSALGLYAAHNTTCLDTGCIWGQQLTAYAPHSGHIISISAQAPL